MVKAKTKNTAEEDRSRSSRIKIKVLNIQGLTKVKYGEVLEMVKDNSILCLTETQKKVRDINISKEIIVMESMRDQKDKKGGGIMVLYKDSKEIELKKIDCKNKDLLQLKGSIYGEKTLILVVYFAVNDKERNKRIKEEIESIIDDEEEAVILTGDFNGHTGLQGTQRVDENGRVILEWMEKYKMILLNEDERCEGVYTWSRNDQRSVIDYALVSQKMYDRVTKIRIDEDKELCDLSDHNMIEIEVAIKAESKKQYKGWITKEYYCKNDKAMEEFSREMKSKVEIEKPKDMKELNDIMKSTADKVLKRKYRRRVEDEAAIEEPPWMTEEIRDGIRRRK